MFEADIGTWKKATKVRLSSLEFEAAKEEAFILADKRGEELNDPYITVIYIYENDSTIWMNPLA